MYNKSYPCCNNITNHYIPIWNCKYKKKCCCCCCKKTNHDSNHKYTVLNPTAYRSEIIRYPLAPRLTTLDGKTIYLIAPKQTGSDIEEVFKVITERIKLKYPTATVIFEYKPSEYFEPDVEFFKKVLSEADAFFYGCAPSSSSTHWSVRYGCELEKQGLPGVMTIYKGLLPSAEITREATGVPIRIQTFEYPPLSMTKEQIDKAADEAIQKLITPLTPEEQKSGPEKLPIPPKEAFTGTIEEINNYFVEKGWTDGLPILPATKESVAKILKGTSHKPDEIVSTTMWPESFSATVEQVAINGVMAGCTKEQLPVLLAAAEAWGKGNFNSAVRSTNSFSFMQVVSGPIASQLKMNGGIYALGPGNQSNASIGRALRLFIINLGGGQPGINMLGTQGNVSMYTFCARENENSPWESLGQTLGYGKDEDVLTILGGGWSHLGNYLSGDLLQISKDVAVFEWPVSLTIIMSENGAKVQKSKGMSKQDVANYVWENCTMTAQQFRSLYYYTWFIEPILKRAEAEGEPAPWPIDYMYLPNDAIVHPFPKDNVYVLVIGGDTNPMMQGWLLGSPVSTSIDKWK